MAKSKLAYTENEYNRQKELTKSKASSDKVFPANRDGLQNTKITLNALAENYD